jgi:predicted RNA-binding Zn-ribbon protein involved in translation (DUF1610 family)
MKTLENIGEVFRTLKHRKPSRIFCPRCASSLISLSSRLDAWLTPKKYICNSCGYVGPVVMELEKIEENGST